MSKRPRRFALQNQNSESIVDSLAQTDNLQGKEAEKSASEENNEQKKEEKQIPEEKPVKKHKISKTRSLLTDTLGIDLKTLTNGGLPTNSFFLDNESLKFDSSASKNSSKSASIDLLSLTEDAEEKFLPRIASESFTGLKKEQEEDLSDLIRPKKKRKKEIKHEITEEDVKELVTNRKTEEEDFVASHYTAKLEENTKKLVGDASNPENLANSLPNLSNLPKSIQKEILAASSASTLDIQPALESAHSAATQEEVNRRKEILLKYKQSGLGADVVRAGGDLNTMNLGVQRHGFSQTGAAKNQVTYLSYQAKVNALDLAEKRDSGSAKRSTTKGKYGW